MRRKKPTANGSLLFWSVLDRGGDSLGRPDQPIGEIEGKDCQQTTYTKGSWNRKRTDHQQVSDERNNENEYHRFVPPRKRGWKVHIQPK